VDENSGVFGVDEGCDVAVCVTVELAGLLADIGYMPNICHGVDCKFNERVSVVVTFTPCQNGFI
jgi:hypothetical protein